jgi:hypothetical protein
MKLASLPVDICSGYSLWKSLARARLHAGKIKKLLEDLGT